MTACSPLSMRVLPGRLLPRGAFAVLAALAFGPSVAQAQMPGQGAGAAPVVDPVELKNPRQAPPAALPGARSDRVNATPADRPLSEMSPNDAMFDSVNRGDIANVRDALSRGADITARNILGLTALDLSIDLGRNDITFLLLSLRGASGGGPAPAAGKTTATRTAAGSAAHTASGPAPKPAARPVAAPQRITIPAARVEPRQLVSTDPGTPVPQAGFLGFGGAARP